MYTKKPKIYHHAVVEEEEVQATVQVHPNSSSAWSKTRLFINPISSQLMNSSLMVFSFISISYLTNNPKITHKLTSIHPHQNLLYPSLVLL
ncbi:hypothetical protein REPUB_Repub14bG0153700 [Reevesia pubescens]